MKPRILILLALAMMLTLGACSDDMTEPEQVVSGNVVHHYTSDDLRAEGDIVETEDGYTVKGQLHVSNGEDEPETSFIDADLKVEFDENGQLKNVTGSAKIPPPSDNVSFDDPVQADVGFFSGEYLNNNRDFNVLLKDEVEYFVFNFSVAARMRIKEDDGEGTELTIQAPIGGQALMIIDYTDPMYYVYGAQDLLGDAGVGQSFNGRIPFEPIRPAADVFSFDAKNYRTGTFSVYKIITITGAMADNTTAVAHLNTDNPMDSQLDAGYQAGTNGEFSIGLDIKNVVGLSIPLGEASSGHKVMAGTSGLYGAAFIDGLTDPDLSWWPDFIPVRPQGMLHASGFVESTGKFDMSIYGEYGVITPGMDAKIIGSFHLGPEDMTISGGVAVNDATLIVTGQVTGEEMSLTVEPPNILLDDIRGSVDREIDESIAEAEQAWNDLQEATKNYEVELSLRGLRTALPGICDTARQKTKDEVAARLSPHKGKVYYNSLKSHVNGKVAPVYTALDDLKAAALYNTDNDYWRTEIERALRKVASYRTVSGTYKYKVAGVTVKTVNWSVTTMSKSQQSQLTTAANNVKYIAATSNIKITMQDIYDQIPDKEIFERVRNDIEDGLVNIPDLQGYGYAQKWDGTIEVFAIISGERTVVGKFNVFDIPEAAAAIADEMVDQMIGD